MATRLGQTKRGSLIEAVMNVVVGYGVAIAAQLVIFPWFGIYHPITTDLQISLAFLVVGLARSYVLRRVFDRFTRCGKL